MAVAIPVIIHLVQLRRPKRVLFTNVAFIRNIENITSSQRKIKDWLILLCRILFIAFLVLVFARPFIPADDNSLGSVSAVKLFIDNSFSMQNEAEKGGLTLLETGIDEATKVLENFPASTRVNLLDNTFKTSSGHSQSRENLLQQLPQISLSPVNRGTDIIYSRLNSGPAAGKAATFWFSDFQKSSFDPGFFAVSDSVSPVNLVVLKPGRNSNVFIDSLALEDELVRPGENNRLLIRVFNSGEADLKGITLKLLIGNRLASSISLDLKAKTSTTASMEFMLNEPGLQQARIEVEDQPITFDNTFHFVLRPASPLRIVDISSVVNNQTGRLYVNEPLFRYQFQRPEQINIRNIEEADLILLNEVTSISAALRDNLKKYVAAGGSLVIVPAEKREAADYNALFQGFGLPVSGTDKNEGLVYQLALPDLQDPFFRNVFSDLDKRLQMPAAPGILNWRRADADILKFRNGAPFLSRFRHGQGRVYVFASPFSMAKNEFSRNAIFVPVMYKLVLTSHQAEQQLAYNFSQRTFSLAVPFTDVRHDVFTLEKDSVKFIPEQQLKGGRMFFSIPVEMSEAGFYQLKHRDTT
ncbi:MAG TPA: BatA domain-containing protein, partial [Adhaeribacter sp.]|nr:BatA domain-containing protein [Adhaeribacter sp.]